MSDFLGVLANILTILAAATAFALFFLGPRVREVVLSYHRWRACRSLSEAIDRRLRSGVWRALRVSGLHPPEPSVGELFAELSDSRFPDGSIDEVSWRTDDLERVSAGLDQLQARLSATVIARVGDPSHADRHAVVAQRAHSIVAADLGYAPPIVLTDDEERVDSGLALLLSSLSAAVLAGPAWAGAPAGFRTGERATFDSVRVSERRGSPAFGVDGTVQQIADSALPGNWGGLLNPGHAESVAQRASELARADLNRGNDSYNGYFPRLLGWRTECATHQAGRRIHFLLGETTFYTWRVMNESANRVPVDDARLFVNDLGDSSRSIGAAHLPVAISLLTADAYLVLRQRSLNLDPPVAWV